MAHPQFRINPLASERAELETLIAVIQVALGRVFAQGGATRRETDCRDVNAALVQAHPGYRRCHIVLDQLSTRQPDSLVRLTAERCGLNIDLGVQVDLSGQAVGDLMFMGFVRRCTRMPPGLLRLQRDKISRRSHSAEYHRPIQGHPRALLQPPG